MGPVRIRHSSHDFGWQSSHSVDLAGWQAKMASIEIWIPWRNAHKPHLWKLIMKCQNHQFTKFISLLKFPGLQLFLYTSPGVSIDISNSTMTCHRLLELKILFFRWGHVHHIMASKIQWKPFWLATQLYPPVSTSWLACAMLCAYDVGQFALAPFQTEALSASTTLAKKIVTLTAEKFMRLINSSIMWYRAMSSFGSTSTRLAASARREVALQIEVDVAWYQMIALRINLMNISAVTIFLARVVGGVQDVWDTSCTNEVSAAEYIHHGNLIKLDRLQVYRGYGIGHSYRPKWMPGVRSTSLFKLINSTVSSYKDARNAKQKWHINEFADMRKILVGCLFAKPDKFFTSSSLVICQGNMHEVDSTLAQLVFAIHVAGMFVDQTTRHVTDGKKLTGLLRCINLWLPYLRTGGNFSEEDALFWQKGIFSWKHFKKALLSPKLASLVQSIVQRKHFFTAKIVLLFSSLRKWRRQRFRNFFFILPLTCTRSQNLLREVIPSLFLLSSSRHLTSRKRRLQFFRAVGFHIIGTLAFGKNWFRSCLMSARFPRLRRLFASDSAQAKAYTVRIGYRVTGYNDLPDITIGLTKIKTKTSKRHTKYPYIQCISAVVIYRI